MGFNPSKEWGKLAVRMTLTSLGKIMASVQQRRHAYISLQNEKRENKEA